MFGYHTDEAIGRSWEAMHAIDVRAAQTSAMPAAMEVSTAGCNASSSQLQNRHSVQGRSHVQVNQFCVFALYTDISTGIDDRLEYTLFSQAFRGSVHGEDLGDATEIDTERTVRGNSIFWQQFYVTPRAPGRDIDSCETRQQLPFHQLRANRDVERAARAGGKAD